MQAMVFVDALDPAKQGDLRIRKLVSFARAPEPIRGDVIDVDGVLLEIRERRITPERRDVIDGYHVALYARVCHQDQVLLTQRGWERV